MDDLLEFGELILVVSGGLSLALGVRAVAGPPRDPDGGRAPRRRRRGLRPLRPARGILSFQDVQRIATLALIAILFEGGSQIGLSRFRPSAVPIAALGVLGTFGTAALIAVAAHVVLDLSWTVSGLLGAALAPTDPAVTFSVLAGKEVSGRSGTILEGESGFNDPVGIALMVGMVEMATKSDGSFSTVVSEFVVEMSVGLAIGVAGALVLRAVLRAAVPSGSHALPDHGDPRGGSHLRGRGRRARLRLPRRLRCGHRGGGRPVPGARRRGELQLRALRPR